MKRTVFGIVLLALLLAGGIGFAVGMTKQNEAVAQQLNCAAEQAMSGNLTEAVKTAREARSAWDEGWNIRAAFTDHNPLEQIDGGFARLEICGRAGDPVAFATVCVELAKQIQAIGDAHGAQWWNIL